MIAVSGAAEAATTLCGFGKDVFSSSCAFLCSCAWARCESCDNLLVCKLSASGSSDIHKAECGGCVVDASCSLFSLPTTVLSLIGRVSTGDRDRCFLGVPPSLPSRLPSDFLGAVRQLLSIKVELVAHISS